MSFGNGTLFQRARSGEYYIVIDAEKCIGCVKCAVQCPQSDLELVTLLIDLEDKTVVAVTEQHRRKIKYTCSPCKLETRKAPRLGVFGIRVE